MDCRRRCCDPTERGFPVDRTSASGRDANVGVLARLGPARLHLGIPLIEMMLTRYAGCEFFSPWRISDDQRIRFEAHERPELAAGDMPRCKLGGKPTVAR